MNMAWLFAFLLLLSSTAQSLFAKIYSGKTDCKPEYSPVVFNFYYSLITAIGALAVGGFVFRPSLQTVLFALISAAATTVYNLAIVRAAQTGPYPVYMVSALFGGIILPTGAGIVFFGDEVRWISLCGVILMLAAIVLLTYTKTGGEKLKPVFLRCCIALFLSNGAFGFAFYLQNRFVSPRSDEITEFVTVAFAVSAAVSFAVLLLKAKKETKKALVPNRAGGLSLFLSAAASCAAQNLQLYVLTLLPSAVVFTFNNGGVLVAVSLLSLLLFKEKMNAVRWCGVAAAIVSIVLLSL